jgi:hypothetical protein
MMQIKINTSFGRYKEGEIVNLESGDGIIPDANFWRKRLRDSAIDNCCEVVKTTEGTEEIPAEVISNDEEND